ncbi:hypothetical protein DEO72_LG11g1516 [Vigna unguiculata]|uniref:Uncharacterized protein n=1 Tax=Vigna unguiculata TaxID=3917 RepID=A0A4D6NQH0_VIGUN|nr:hypothetical protein DEO72_LG11g1516 [Vigna unguiculata]
MCGKTCYGSYTATPGRVPIYEHSPYSSQDYQTRQPTTEEGNLSGPIRTGHNPHTHTGNTRKPEPQLKGPSCSSAIPSHNSRDAIPSHNSRNTTCLTPISSHNSRDTSISRLAGDTCRQALPAPRPPGGCRVLPGAQHLKIHLAAGTAWRYYPHRQAPVPQLPSVTRLSPSGPIPAARRCISTAALQLSSLS